MLVNARIKRFVSFAKYNDDTFVELFRDAGIEVDIKDRPPSEITFLD
jgi:dCMP deaminase